MRRLALLLALTLALLVPAVASAQFQYGPGGGIIVSTAEVSASGQVATAQTIIPSTIQTTQTALCVGQHCQLDVSGVMSTANSSAGTLTPAFSYGGIAVTFNARTLETALTNVPWRLVCMIAPDSTVAGGSGGITGKSIECTFTYVPSVTQGTAPFSATAVATGTITYTATQTMVATLTFSATTNATGAIARRQWFGAGS